ncbi:MAG: hypothetical protein US49_C0012G0011 [candidate division TM6 bacterium GW2011_GWF2_37_49]|nr:MAG: hypothetical protein US49_C0012G0011 [candidate division TM6 bacterium GW2011_GWF2_37_49]
MIPSSSLQIETVSLFPEINKQLIILLKSLDENDWHKPTVLPGRTVKDLASHILDGSLRRLSMCRDNYHANGPKIESNEDLIKYVQALNKTWIEATHRLSPIILISFLEFSEQWNYEYLKTLDPSDKAKFPVTWAGEFESQNWFDIAREYTEKWHHQMQIRLAVNKPGINSSELFYPAIDTFMKGVPHVFKDTNADLNCGIEIHIIGNGGGFWFLEKTETQWQFVKNLKNAPDAKIKMSDDTAWQLFTDSISKDVAAKSISITGNKLLGEAILNTRTVLR